MRASLCPQLGAHSSLEEGRAGWCSLHRAVCHIPLTLPLPLNFRLHPSLHVWPPSVPLHTFACGFFHPVPPAITVSPYYQAHSSSSGSPEINLSEEGVTAHWPPNSQAWAWWPLGALLPDLAQFLQRLPCLPCPLNLGAQRADVLSLLIAS